MTEKKPSNVEKIDGTKIKTCGISTREAVDAAIDAGADYVGFVHFEKSPRHVTLEQAAALRSHAGGRIQTALLLVNAEPELTGKALEAIRPDVVQFHGSETPEWLQLVRKYHKVEIWKALGVKDAETLATSRRYIGAADRLLFDAPAQALPGGTGKSFDWSLLAEFDHQLPWGLAGGLTPENVSDAIRLTGARLVDTSSGVESAPGVKDVNKIAAFCEAVREYNAD